MERLATVLMSGGLDSLACAAFLNRRGFQIQSVFIDYGQKAATPEKNAVEILCERYGWPLRQIAITGLSPSGPGELIGRNAFLAMAALMSTEGTSTVIAMGLHSGTPYFDCTPEFSASIDAIIKKYSDGKTTFIAPFIDWTKKDIFDYCLRLKIPINLSYSCESGTVPVCRKCLSCLDREALGC